MFVEHMPITSFQWNKNIRSVKRSFQLVLGSSSEGEDGTLNVLEIAGEEDGPALLVLAGVHGDEYEGIETILRLYHSLSPKALRGSLLMIPASNPYAFQGGTRVSPVDGANLARVFPGNTQGTPTERLAYELHHRFIASSDFLLDLHSGGTHYAVASLAGYYHNEQTVYGQKCRKAAEAFGSELLWAHPEIGSGRTVSSAQALGIPWLYTEAYGGRRIRSEDSLLFFNGAMRLLRHLKMLANPDQWIIAPDPPMRRTIYSDGNFDNSALSEADGFFIPAVSLLTKVNQGDRIGTIYGLDGAELHNVTAAEEGLVVMLLGTPVVRKGEPIYLLAALE
ncbi:succinylglutamate desuccinylase/aspartoacylase family protein [Paenibacillus silviterrae]|uniref:succinylglutamate desuccinylase/aspartoacylase family protein n=1 Tax=Paenibacillus silviterrae TaxID=3242194 RepID=UPI002543BC76|nr:M14 family metallopeptidase [Paenibacillus chinjuensis]